MNNILLSFFYTNATATNLNMQTGLQITREALIAKLNNLFYQEVENARYCGDFAVRGSVVDVVCGKNGIRIDFFGNQIESIKAFCFFKSKVVESMWYL